MSLAAALFHCSIYFIPFYVCGWLKARMPDIKEAVSPYYVYVLLSLEHRVIAPMPAGVFV